jgi:hypothetical protein
MTLLKWDNYGWFRDKNWQVGQNFNNEENTLPTSKILQCGWQMINIMQKKNLILWNAHNELPTRVPLWTFHLVPYIERATSLIPPWLSPFLAKKD